MRHYKEVQKQKFTLIFILIQFCEMHGAGRVKNSIISCYGHLPKIISIKSISPLRESKIFNSLEGELQANLKNLVPREKNTITDDSVHEIALPYSLLYNLFFLYPRAKIIKRIVKFFNSLDKNLHSKINIP